MTRHQIRDLTRADQEWVGSSIELRWGSRKIVSRGRLFYPENLDGLVAIRGGRPVGLLTLHFENGECEIVSMDSFLEGQGVGSSMLEAARERAVASGSRRLWLVTTNDNLQALGFYQKRGFRIAAVYQNAIDISRKLKPEIPEVGMNRIPIRDEIELEIILDSQREASEREA